MNARAETTAGFDWRALLTSGLGVPLGVLSVLAMIVLPLQIGRAHV